MPSLGNMVDGLSIGHLARVQALSFISKRKKAACVEAQIHQ